MQCNYHVSGQKQRKVAGQFMRQTLKSSQCDSTPTTYTRATFDGIVLSFMLLVCIFLVISEHVLVREQTCETFANLMLFIALSSRALAKTNKTLLAECLIKGVWVVEEKTRLKGKRISSHLICCNYHNDILRTSLC